MSNHAIQNEGENRTLLRFSTAGSVDDGKSTLIGRLLFDLGAIHDDTYRSVERASKRLGVIEDVSLALVTDGLKAEQEQGITIDVAYRYFTTKRRRFILADSPGHEQYTRNMATAASTADLTIVLIDATKGILPQTRRHAFIASLMGVPRLLVTINKMDMIDFDQGKFETICDEFTQFAGKLGIKDVRFVPVSALRGDNIVQRSKNIPWYKGETVLEYLEHVYISGDRNLVDFRLPIQCVIRGQGTYRTYAGRIASGSIRVGEEVLVLPALKKTTISKIENFDAPERGLEEASAPQSVSVCLADEVDMARGCMLVRPNNVPNLKTTFEAMVVWMSETPLNLSQHYLVRHTTAESKAYVDKISYSIDVESLNRTETQTLRLNEIGRLTINTAKPLALDVYQNNRATGNFILIDPQTFATLGAGMVIERRSEEPRTKSGTPLNLHFEDSLVTRAERRLRSNFAPKTIWLTGLSGAGKSTIAKAIERKLFDLGISVYRLDGDNLRSGLNSNLGFSKEDRTENLRRAAEVAQLMNDAGLMVVAAFISPHQADREIIKKVVGPENFIHIYLSTPLEVCESRDPHGLYKKSRSGEVKNFTGVSSPFEAPADHNLIIDTSNSTIEQSVETIFALIQN